MLIWLLSFSTGMQLRMTGAFPQSAGCKCDFYMSNMLPAAKLTTYQRRQALFLGKGCNLPC